MTTPTDQQINDLVTEGLHIGQDSPQWLVREALKRYAPAEMTPTPAPAADAVMLNNDDCRCVGRTADATCPKRDDCARYTEWIAPHHGASERAVPVVHWRCKTERYECRIPVDDEGAHGL